MLSGGPDSVLALQEALTTTSDPVVALHVSLVNGGRRWERELAACRRIVPLMQRRFRPFDYHEGRSVWPVGTSPADMPALAPHMAALCLHYRDIGKTWTGEDFGTNGRTDAHMLAALRACLYEERYGVAPPTDHWPPPGGARPKHVVRALLGDLWGLSWSCREPTITGEPCGTCHSCRDRAQAELHPLGVGA